MNKTTVAHIIIERLTHRGITLEFPDTVKGDLIEEHDWAMSTAGFDLINSYSDVFNEVCNEVDDQVQNGSIIFTDEGFVISI
jgi:hypothetical protein